MEIAKYLCEFFFYELLALAWVDCKSDTSNLQIGHVQLQNRTRPI